MKPKLLYVYRDSMDWRSPDVQREYRQRDGAIVDALADKFYVTTWKNLHTLKPEHAGKFPFILTHLQNDPENQTFTYGESLVVIDRIHKEHPDTKIVVYTGAFERAVTDEQLKEAGATAVIRKQSIRQLQEDVNEVRKCLEALLNEQP